MRVCLRSEARDALLSADVDTKLARVAALTEPLADEAFEQARAVELTVPLEPGRPPRPLLVAPKALKRRSTATAEGHAALIHAVTHIEFNAINLALDAICRFPGLPAEYYEDWLQVAAEEAHHFALLRTHLRTLARDYGDFPAHDGLWEMAVKTAHDPLARMALVPRVLEARGLDASPAIIRRLREAEDQRGAEIVEIILADEVGHVAIGSRWFMYLCGARGLDPQSTFEEMLHAHNAPRAVLPLNIDARRRARFSEHELAHIEATARSRPPKQAH